MTSTMQSKSFASFEKIFLAAWARACLSWSESWQHIFSLYKKPAIFAKKTSNCLISIPYVLLGIA